MKAERKPVVKRLPGKYGRGTARRAATTFFLSWAVLLSMAMLISCKPAAAPSATPAAAPAAIPVALPRPEGVEVYKYITQTNSYKSWSFWPGLSAMYTGKSEAHGPVLNNYVSEDVKKALSDNSAMPEGGIVVKENFNNEKVLQALTVMYKAKGYDPQHDDWFWGYYKPDGSIIDQGKIKMCIDCHELAKNRPYIWSDSPPVIVITAPKEGAALSAGNIEVSVSVNNIILANKLGQAKAEGEGHLHFYMDVEIPTAPDKPAVSAPGTYKATSQKSAVWNNVPAGTHTFGAQLVNNNHTPLSPPVTAKATVTVSGSPGAGGGSAGGGAAPGGRPGY